jgi:hypothetical protein
MGTDDIHFLIDLLRIAATTRATQGALHERNQIDRHVFNEE